MKQLRVLALAPSLVLTALLVAACASAPPRPPAPIATGEPRAEPQPPLEGAETEEAGLGELEPGEQAEAAGKLTPPHMTGREIMRAGVLLPFSHPNRRVRAEAQGLLAGIELALFELAGDTVLVMPKDTEGTTGGAETALMDAMADGADVILGPLFAENVRTIAPLAQADDIPVIAFSNDPAAAQGGVWLASYTVGEEVARIVSYAASRGVDLFAFLGPRSTYGQRVERALRFEAARSGTAVIASQFYDPANDAPVDEAKLLAERLAPQVNNQPNRVGVIIPEEGVKLRAVAPLLAYYGVDYRRMRMLGTSQWDDPALWREPTLDGAWFPVAPREEAQGFEASYTRIYGRSPSDLASLGYDAAAVAIRLGERDALDAEGLTGRDGFIGANGLFRFRSDGLPERGLAVMEVDTQAGAQLVSPAPLTFEPPVG